MLSKYGTVILMVKKQRFLTKTFKLSPELLEKIDRVARERNLTESQLIRVAIENAVTKEFEDPIWVDVNIGQGKIVKAPLSAVVGEYLKSVRVSVENNRELLRTLFNEMFEAWRTMKKSEKRKKIQNRKSKRIKSI